MSSFPVEKADETVPAIAVRGLHKYFGHNEVLKGIDFYVDPGQVVCVIGPSGSGKSTLLRCVNRLEEPDVGRDPASRASTSATPRPTSTTCARRIGMVFQQFNLFPHLYGPEEPHPRPADAFASRSKEEAVTIARHNLERVGLSAEGGGLSRPPLRRPAAARRDRPGAVA